MNEHIAVTLNEHPETLSTGWNRILPAAILLTLAGAGIWGGLLILTGMMAWIVAIGIGVGIGTVLSRISGPMNDATCILAAGSTLIAVLSGQIWFLVDLTQKLAVEEGVSMQWTSFLIALPGYFFGAGLMDTLFTVGGGLLGAVYAIRRSQPTQ